MSRRSFLVRALVAILPLVALADGQTLSPQTPQRNTVAHASWTAALEKNYGIRMGDFRDMGLGSLTTEQELNLFVWIETQKQQAKESVPAQTFSCGRPAEPLSDAKPEAYDKVRVYVSATGDASEVISGVRERFRSMNGIEVVYSSGEADVTVSLVALNLQNTSGYHTGVAISYVVQQPCVLKFGSSKTSYDTVENQGLQMGSDIPAVVVAIVSRIDTSDLEDHRQMNAWEKKFLQMDVKK